MESDFQIVVTVGDPLLIYLLVIWTAGLGDLRAAMTRRLIVSGLAIVSVLVIIAIELSEADRLRQAAWHMIGLLTIALLAWSAKTLIKRR